MHPATADITAAVFILALVLAGAPTAAGACGGAVGYADAPQTMVITQRWVPAQWVRSPCGSLVYQDGYWLTERTVEHITPRVVYVQPQRGERPLRCEPTPVIVTYPRYFEAPRCEPDWQRNGSVIITQPALCPPPRCEPPRFELAVSLPLNRHWR